MYIYINVVMYQRYIIALLFFVCVLFVALYAAVVFMDTINENGRALH